ncbi:MAG: PAS domain S-box protein, partial [Bacteroidia bacterium]|nr:PAS domain S-box protein [Bacteroidia bacterium]
MNLSDKTREELINELISLRKSNDELKKCCEKAGNRLSYSEELFRKAFSTNPDAVNINRLEDGLFTAVNEGFTRITGYTWDDVKGKTSVELNIWYNTSDREIVVQKLREKGNIDNYESVFIAKDGSFIQGLMSASIIDLDGIPHILNITKDITERKKTEEELRKEQFLFNSLMNNLKDAVYFKDRESRFIRINKMHIEKFGIKDPSEARGKTDFDFFSEEHARQSFIDEQEIISTGKSITKEERETNEGKPDRWVSTVKMPMFDSDGNIEGTFGISRDITDRKRSELEKEVITDIIRGVTTTSDINEFFRHVHYSLSRIVTAENIFVALYDFEARQFTFPYFIDKYDEIPPPSEMKKSCTSYVFRSGKVLVFTKELFDKLIKDNEVEEVGSPSPSWVGI